MNEKIKELYKKAYGVSLSVDDFVLDQNEKEFAELIIRECLACCDRVENDDELSREAGTFADGALLCGEEIKTLFGVE